MWKSLSGNFEYQFSTTLPCATYSEPQFSFSVPFAGAQYLQMFGLQALVIDSLQIQSTEQDLHSWKPQNECACTGSGRGVGSHCLLLKLALTTIRVQHRVYLSQIGWRGVF